MGTGADPAGRWRRDDVLPEDMKEAGAGAKPTSALNLLNLDPVQHFFVDVLADTVIGNVHFFVINRDIDSIIRAM